MEEAFFVNGGKELFGKVELHGAKNAVLPMLAASLLTDEEVEIKDCPSISDVDNMLELVREVGGEVFRFGRNIRVRGQAVKNSVSTSLQKVMRSSMFMLGTLLATVGEVKTSLPGGCAIGGRPLDIHLDGLKMLGATCQEIGDEIFCRAKELKGAKIVMRYPSVGATENLLLASCKAKGKTTLINCAREPEIVSLVGLLNNMGAKIRGEGTSVLEIDGVESLHGASFTPVADRIVGGTLLSALSVCGGEIEICGLDERLVGSTLCALRSKNFETFDDGLCLRARAKKVTDCSEEVACDLTTGPYPLFATDMQPIVSAVKCFGKGVSRIRETVFESRFSHLSEMKKLGANVKIDGDVALLSRGDLRAGDMRARDLRGGAGLLVFALGLAGESRIFGTSFVKRGYENIDETMRKLGADMRIIKN